MDDELKIKMYSFTVDCKEPHELAKFYAALLKWEKMFIDELGEDAGPITYLKTDIDNEILDILKNLPVKYRDVFLLKYSNHMSNAEISKILNISEGTIRQRIARGKLIIKEEIERLEGK